MKNLILVRNEDMFSSEYHEGIFESALYSTLGCEKVSDLSDSQVRITSYETSVDSMFQVISTLDHLLREEFSESINSGSYVSVYFDGKYLAVFEEMVEDHEEVCEDCDCGAEGQIPTPFFDYLVQLSNPR